MSTSVGAGSSIAAWEDLVLTDERAELVDAVGRHLAARFPREVLRTAFDTGAQPADAWAEVVASDYQLIGVPEAHGGVGTLPDLVALLEAAGRELLPTPLLATAMALQTQLAAGLPVADDLERPAALAVGATIHGGTVTAPSLVVLDGALAERLTVVADAGSATTVAVVDCDAAPPTAVHHHVDPGRPVAVHELRGAPALRVATVPLEAEVVLAPARVALAADLTGVAAGALDHAVQHAVEREQFGKAIGAFQGVKHRLADVYVAVERARSLTRAAAATAAAGNVDALRELSLLAKAAAADAAVAATRAHVQVLGAMGMTFEADAHLYFRRAQQTVPFLGTATWCYARAARRWEADRR